jgi:hypothetical protein
MFGFRGRVAVADGAALDAQSGGPTSAPEPILEFDSNNEHITATYRLAGSVNVVYHAVAGNRELPQLNLAGPKKPSARPGAANPRSEARQRVPSSSVGDWRSPREPRQPASVRAASRIYDPREPEAP